MGLSLSVLLAPTTVAAAEQDIIDSLDALGFSASSWQVKSGPRTFVHWFATKYASVTQTIASIAAGGYLSTSAEKVKSDGTDDVDWLDLYADSQYAEFRAPATFTTGTMRFSNSTGSPIAVAVGQFWAQDVASRKYRFTNTTDGGGSIAAGGFLDLAVRAESAGTAYNLTNNTTLELATPVPGLTVTNPPVGATGTWITTAGANLESNASYSTRARAKWATLGTGAGALAYISWAQAGAPSVTKVLVDDGNPDGPGTIRVYLANASGPASGAEITAANNYIQPRRALTSKVTTLAATAHVVPITATIEVLAAYAATALAAATANIATYSAALQIGEDVYLSEIFTALSSPTGIRRVTITAPAVETTVIGPSEIVSFTLNLTTTLV